MMALAIIRLRASDKIEINVLIRITFNWMLAEIDSLDIYGLP